ncbi:uncharacterized protein LOC122535147 [Frieseomelitta varia]|uniref:uncharacterized protein LOC122535147 n=1 Tax=Frieseomelitta varia TaxID=561572 RepID=UPI001CB6A023|nr:uncharacterized protein LOC122535147 [Frieseomelitta varia]
MTLRSKSTSHILEIQTAHNKRELEDNSTSTEDKYRTYTVEDFIERRKRFSGNVNDETKKIQSVNRSQNFVKKIIASFENKNEVCRANDEFFTRYYGRDNRKHDTSVKVKNNEAEVPPVSSVEASKIYPEELACSNAETRNCTESNNSLESTAGTFDDQENNFKINEKDRKHCKEDYVQCDSINDIEVCSYEGRAYYDPSTFDPRRDRVELQNRTGVILESSPNNRKGNTLERICKFEFTNLKMERDSKRNTTKKGFKGRNKFFKCFRSVIKWRKSEAKDRSQRFMFHDDSFEGTNRARPKSNKISKSSPYETIVFQENLEQTNERKATIHPIYEGRRNKRLAKKNEDRKRLMIQGNMENVVKPSAIKNIVKHLSQFP